MKPYAETKESGVEWLGVVPGHWRPGRLRYLAELNPSKSEIAGDGAFEVSFLPMEAVGNDGSLRLDQTRAVEDVQSGYTYFAEGDVTYAKITPCFENGKGAVMRGLTGGFGFGTTELTVLRPRDGRADADYLYWLLSAPDFRELGEASMYGAGGQKRVPDDFARDFAMPFPPLPEQRAIAAFLDRETGRIDALVAEQRRLIALLAEKRRATISHAVTRGLDPTAPLKPSGIDWLGEVPAHWEMVRLKHVIAVNETGTSVNGADYPAQANEVGVLKISAVSTGALVVTENKTVTGGDLRRVACPLRGGCVLVSRANTPDLVGAAAFVEQDHANLFLPDKLWQLHTDGVSGRFLHLWMQTSVYRDQVKVACSGASASMQNLGRDHFDNFAMGLPPMDEQTAIIARLADDERTFAALTQTAQRAIALLAERRAALVSAAVTGKIDVREASDEVASGAMAGEAA